METCQNIKLKRHVFVHKIYQDIESSMPMVPFFIQDFKGLILLDSSYWRIMHEVHPSICRVCDLLMSFASSRQGSLWLGACLWKSISLKRKPHSWYSFYFVEKFLKIFYFFCNFLQIFLNFEVRENFLLWADWVYSSPLWVPFEPTFDHRAPFTLCFLFW